MLMMRSMTFASNVASRFITIAFIPKKFFGIYWFFFWENVDFFGLVIIVNSSFTKLMYEKEP